MDGQYVRSEGVIHEYDYMVWDQNNRSRVQGDNLPILVRFNVCMAVTMLSTDASRRTTAASENRSSSNSTDNTRPKRIKAPVSSSTSS